MKCQGVGKLLARREARRWASSHSKGREAPGAGGASCTGCESPGPNHSKGFLDPSHLPGLCLSCPPATPKSRRGFPLWVLTHSFVCCSEQQHLHGWRAKAVAGREGEHQPRAGENTCEIKQQGRDFMCFLRKQTGNSHLRTSSKAESKNLIGHLSKALWQNNES